MKNLYNKIAKDNNIPIEVVELAYKSFWKFINNSISALPLKEDINEEDFNRLKTSFNIPELGKLYTTYSRIEAIKNKYNVNKNKKS